MKQSKSHVFCFACSENSRMNYSELLTSRLPGWRKPLPGGVSAFLAFYLMVPVPAPELAPFAAGQH
jgi:hypothetical protein